MEFKVGDRVEFGGIEKRKVTKTITRWVNIYSNGDQDAYTSKEDATLYATSGRIACVELTGTYEVEE